MFPSATVELAGGRELKLSAQGAPATYVSSVEVSTGSAAPVAWDQPWLPASILHTGGSVGFTLSTAADPAWGTGQDEAPPSYTQFAAPAVGYTVPSGTVPTPAGAATPVTLGLQSDQRGTTTVQWKATTHGVTVVPSSGTLVLPASSSTAPYPRTSTTLQLTMTSSGTGEVRVGFPVAGAPRRCRRSP